MDYKDKLSNLYSILKENFSEDIVYTKEKDYLYLECKGIETPNHSNLTLNIKMKYSDLMLNEMCWGYSAGESADNHYVLRSDTLASIEKSLKDIIGTEKFNKKYLDTLPKNEATNQIQLKVINEITSLNLNHWQIHNEVLIPNSGMIQENFILTTDILNNYDTIKMLELKQLLNNEQAYHEIMRVKEVLKRLL